MPQHTQPKPSILRSTKTRETAAVQAAVNEHCLLNYGTSYAAGVPYRLSLPSAELWIVPAVLTSPGYGRVGDVGMVAIDAVTKEVIAATPSAEVRAAGTRLANEKRDELDAAFRRARKA
jgi:hypothetical protein